MSVTSCHKCAGSKAFRVRSSLPSLVLTALVSIQDYTGLAVASRCVARELSSLLGKEGSGSREGSGSSNVRTWARHFLSHLSSSLDSMAAWPGLRTASRSNQDKETSTIVVSSAGGDDAVVSCDSSLTALSLLLDEIGKLLLLSSSEYSDPLLYLASARAAGSCRALASHFCSGYHIVPEPWRGAEMRHCEAVLSTYTSLLSTCYEDTIHFHDGGGAGDTRCRGRGGACLKSSGVAGDMRDAVCTAMHSLLCTTGLATLALSSSALGQVASVSAIMLQANLTERASAHLACLVNVTVCELAALLLNSVSTLPTAYSSGRFGRVSGNDDLVDVLLDCHDITGNDYI